MTRYTRRPILSSMFTSVRSNAAGQRSMSCSAVSEAQATDRKSTRLNSSHEWISYAVFCLKKKKKKQECYRRKGGRTITIQGSDNAERTQGQELRTSNLHSRRRGDSGAPQDPEHTDERHQG